MIFLILLFPISGFAGFSELSAKYDYEFKTKPVRKQKTVQPKSKKRGKINKLLNQLKENDKSISKYLDDASRKLIIRKSDDSLRSLAQIEGTLLNSIIATNWKETTLLVKLNENEFFDEGKVRCFASTFGKRVVGKCNLLVTKEKEYQIDAELWGIDGAEGLVSDHFYDGEEKSFITSSFASFLEGAVSGAREKINTPYGSMDKSNSKNQILSGLVGVAGNVGNKIKESSEKNLKLALINSGKRAIVFFQSGVKL